jgi:hypothetical protein
MDTALRALDERLERRLEWFQGLDIELFFRCPRLAELESATDAIWRGLMVGHEKKR